MRHCSEKTYFMSHIKQRDDFSCDILTQRKAKNAGMSHDTIKNKNSWDIYVFDDGSGSRPQRVTPFK